LDKKMILDAILNAANYESICDFSYIPPENKHLDINILKQNAIIFCKTDFIRELFLFLEKSDFKYTIITHHSDYEVNENLFRLKPKSVIEWFAINVAFNHDQLKPIPLGVKTHRGIYVEMINGEPFYKIDWMSENMSRLRDKTKNNKIYCNWSNTNNSRNYILKDLEKNNLPFIRESGLSFVEYLENMSSYKYVISPPGNGIDCHRTWESLYLGCIPIVIKNSIYDAWDDLPILQVNDYSELDYEVLESFSNREFTYEKLSMDYWTKIIKK